MTRPDWTQWALGVAAAVAARADCTRRQVGAVILDSEHRVLSVGYNGAPSGAPGCASDGACPRGRRAPGKQACLECGGVGRINSVTGPRAYVCRNCGGTGKVEGVQPGSSYDTGPGSCIAVHAEPNALMHSDPIRRRGGTLYVTDEPCGGCARLIAGSGLARAVWPGGEWVA